MLLQICSNGLLLDCQSKGTSNISTTACLSAGLSHSPWSFHLNLFLLSCPSPGVCLFRLVAIDYLTCVVPLPMLFVTSPLSNTPLPKDPKLYIIIWEEQLLACYHVWTYYRCQYIKRTCILNHLKEFPLSISRRRPKVGQKVVLDRCPVLPWIKDYDFKDRDVFVNGTPHVRMPPGNGSIA